MSRFVFGVHEVTNEAPLLSPDEHDDYCHIWTHGADTLWPCLEEGLRGLERPPAACGSRGIKAWVNDLRHVFDGNSIPSDLSYSDWHKLYESEYGFCPDCLDALIEELHETAEVEGTHPGGECDVCEGEISGEYIERRGVLYCSADCLNEVVAHA